jgi:hypothetical protein
MNKRTTVGVVAFALTIVAAPSAWADDLDCTTAVEEERQAAAAGKLRRAHKTLTTCAERCAGPVAMECAEAAVSALDRTPTLLVEAQDPRGNDVTDVTVTIDGEVVAKEIDGRSLSVDPGSHTVVVSRRGSTASQTVVTSERTKAQPVRFTLGGATDPDGPARDVGGHTVWPWAVVAIGGAVVVAGVAVVLTTPGMPAGCDDTTRQCRPLAGETAQSFEQRRDQAGLNVDQPLIGALTIGAGGLLVGGALAWHFLESTEPRAARRRPAVAPWLAREGGGLAATGTF